MRLPRPATALIVAIMALPQVAAAQSEDALLEAFSGEWYIFDSSFGQQGDPCSIRLENPSTTVTQNCAAPLGSLESWNIQDGRIFLSGSDGVVLILGGNQFRLTGEMTAGNKSVIVERAQGDSHSQQIVQALREHGCYYRGTTPACASSEATGRPDVDQELGYATVETLADLNVRAQPRYDAPVVGTIEAETMVRVNQCLTATDGVWCRARFGEDVAWLAKTALRLDEWPVITYETVSPEQAE